MRTANPAFGAKVFDRVERGARSDAMTVQGAINKTGVLLAILLLAAGFTWNKAHSLATPGSVMPWMWGGLIAGFILAMITIFVPKVAPLTTPFYATAEGLFLGAISAFYESAYGGIVSQAVLLTCGVLFTMLVAYRTGMIKVTQKFRAGVVAATGAVFFFYLISMILGMFGVGIPLIHGSGMMGIGFSAVVIVIAALNLVLDFDFFERAAACGAPKYMEWYAAFGLLVTLVWLYLEILRLLSKLNSRR